MVPRLDELISNQQSVVAILDPPRVGIEPSVCTALRQHPAVSKIVFVSCNPSGRLLRKDYVVHGGTLASSIEVLCGPKVSEQDGAPFDLVYANAVDLFPHTPHCELVLSLER